MDQIYDKCSVPADLAELLESRGYHVTGIAYIVEEKPKAEEPDPVEWIPSVGDRVKFNAYIHYYSATSRDPISCTPGEAIITATAPGSDHPYHLKRVGYDGPYGWVDRNTFTKMED